MDSMNDLACRASLFTSFASESSCSPRRASSFSCRTRLYLPLVSLRMSRLRCYVYAGAAALMSQIYKEHKHDDGFLYVQYSSENTFG